MSINLQAAINYMLQLKNQGVTYSMTGSRTGSDGTADCSGAVYTALRNAGASDGGWVLNTESMHDWLVKNGFKCYAENVNFSPKKGDIFIWGKRGESAGAGGHTGIFYDDAENIIHCNYGYNGVTINNYDTIAGANGWPYSYIYRYQGSTTAPKPAAKSAAKATNRKVYQVNALAQVNGIWQVKCDYLVPVEFDWTANGIACGDITLTDANGNPTANQVTQVGNYFTIDVGSVGNCTAAEEGSGGYLWSLVDFKTGGQVWLSIFNKNDLLYK